MSQQGYASQPPHGYEQRYQPAKSPGTAALLEVLLGFFFQLFGIGHIYSGRVGTGLVVMFSYWILQGINILLMLVVVGFITFPLTWLIYMIASPLTAANACREPY